MRFALIENTLVEAAPGSHGICPGCSKAVIAKCGKQRIHHWAHRNDKMCDNWWEPETEWHRSWKDNFPKEWQEIFLPDEQSGEKHIADLLTDYGLVIEFQHSPIKPDERASRENFYQNMIWVADGMRLQRDFNRFFKKKKKIRETDLLGIFRVEYPEDYFPVSWLGSAMPVIFDFRSDDIMNRFNAKPIPLYCLFPTRIANYVTVAEIPRKAFIISVINGDWLLRASSFMDVLKQEKREWETMVAIQRKQLELQSMIIQRFQRPVRYKIKRRL